MSEREAARDMLRELLREALAGTNGDAGHAPGAPPAVPAPPVAAVLRPSTWNRPPSGGEVIAGRADGGTEWVTLESDEDLARFVLVLLARFENDGERAAIRSGKVRFALRRPGADRPAGGPADGAVRVDRGAVTERIVEQAAKAGARLVLGPGAVLTPLAREKARAKGIAIEREGRC